MKRTKSIFFKTVLWLTPIVLMLDLLVLFLSYNITYDNNLKLCENQLRNAANLTVQYCESYNLYNNMESKELGKEYNKVCESFDITYVYVVDLDPEKNTETYLAIGFGKNASQEAKDARYPSVTVEGMVNDAEIKAYNGDENGEILHEKNRFDDSLIYYLPIKRYFKTSTLSYEKYDHPLILGAEISLDALVDDIQKEFRKIALLTVSVSALLIAAFGLILYFKVTKPVRWISDRMSHFITYREEGYKKLDIKGNDEFAQMAQAFDTMADEIDTYIDDIDALTREKHTQEAELNIARQIQMGLLRPGCLENTRIAIDAYMLPAKDVGGDLYEYQLLDDGRVFVTVADVSGKGISAALFMSRAITMLHQFMLTETSPAKILALYNDTMAAQNPSGLFITTFLAVWDPRTGMLTYSNAGHNFPYILSGDTLTMLEDAHGVAAGLFEGEEYENATVQLKGGDTFFLYTDGVNEAKNTDGAFYSTERLEEKLIESAKTDSSEAMSVVLNDLNGFTRDAVQSDDITILTLHIKPTTDEIDLKLSSKLNELVRIKKEIFSLPASSDLKKKLILAAEEIFVNICSYAYTAPGKVEMKIAKTGDGIEITFIDGGKPFDPTRDLPDIDEYDHENTIGGLGRFLTFSIADRYHYEYRDGKNILYLFFSEVNPDDYNENT